MCDDCGEEFAGFREEQMDDLLAGTAISNRVSQASQAKSIREKIESRERSQNAFGMAPSEKVLSDEVALCESVFLLARAIVDRLIQLRYTSANIREPLFEILTHWVRRRHAGVKAPSRQQKQFKSHVVLSLICLAAIYVRSPMLPRDLCRLVALRQVPFLTALSTVLPKHLTASRAVVDAFTLNSVPVARQIAENINTFGTDKFAWPPLREFFASNAVKDRLVRPYEDALDSIRSFPVGHLHITLLRLSRLVGLPDEFGARVLRYIELRRIATKMARVMHKRKDGPWDCSKLDSYEIRHIPHYNDLELPFCKPVGGDKDCFGFPTDQSVQVDFINTMRLCYGTRPPKAESRDKRLKCAMARDDQMAAEWEGCKDTMMKWLSHGSNEDRASVLWTSLSLNVHADVQGRALEEYSQFVDDVLFGEKIPAFMVKFAKVFEDIAQSDDGVLESSQRLVSGGYVDSLNCIYKTDREDSWYVPKEGKEDMQRECGVAADGSEEAHRRLMLTLPYRDYRKRKYISRKERKRRFTHEKKAGVRFSARLRRLSADKEHLSNGELRRYDGNAEAPDAEKHGETEIDDQGVGENEDRKSKKRKTVDDFWCDDTWDAQSMRKRRKVDDIERLSDEKVFSPTENSSLGLEDTVEARRERIGNEMTPSWANNSMDEQDRVEEIQTQQRWAGEADNDGMDEKDDVGNRIEEEAERNDQEEHWSSLGLEHGELPWWIAYLRECNTIAGKEGRKVGQRGVECTLRYLDLLQEPAGIGLAWTMIRCFFGGSSIDVFGVDKAFTVNHRDLRDMMVGCNNSLQAVITYIIGLQHDLRHGCD